MQWNNPQDFYEKVSPATLKLKGAGAAGGIAGGLCAFAQCKYRIRK